MRILRAAERVAVPWKNGGGVTREVAIWPAASDFDDFDWRISIADVRAAGPFSIFANIDRTMLILQGRLKLDFADRAVDLDSHSEPFAFPGDVPCSGTPVGGDVMDLNVMTRRGRCSARVERLSTRPQTLGTGRALIVASGVSVIEAGTEQVTLNAFDAIYIEGDVAVRLKSGGGFWIALSER